MTEISICETEEGTEVELILDPFVYRYDFKVTGTIAGTEVSFTRADVDKVWIKDMDQFVAYEEIGVHYRMYEPVHCVWRRDGRICTLWHHRHHPETWECRKCSK